MNARKIATSLIAKSGEDRAQWLPLWMHSRDTGLVMCLLWEQWIPVASRNMLLRGQDEAEMRKLCCFLGRLHDVGKATIGFQCKIAPAVDVECTRRLRELELEVPEKAAVAEGVLSHARASQIIFLDYVNQQNQRCPEMASSHEGIASILGSHHGMTQCNLREADMELGLHPRSYYGQQKALWQEIWRCIIEDALEQCGWKSVHELPQLSRGQQMVLCGMLIMADWIASNQHYFPLIPAEELGEEALYPARVEQGWKQLRLPDYWMVSGFGIDAQSFKDAYGYTANEVQREVLDIANEIQTPGIMIIEAQMGVGKTEAALAASEIFAQKLGSGGLFFGLPTQATANGIFPRLLEWAQRFPEDAQLSIRLAHGAAEMNENYRALFEGDAAVSEDGEQERLQKRDAGSGLVVHSWFHGNKQALLSDFVIGTVDQLLMAALKQKHVMLRHFGLVGKIIIVDECHAYDAYMNCYLYRTLEWLGAYGTPVIILSATLPMKRRSELIDSYLSHAALKKDEKAAWRKAKSYPLITWTDGTEVKQRSIRMEKKARSVEFSWHRKKERIQLLREALQDGGCAGVICNTVAGAQEFAAEARRELPDIEVILFHSRFLLPDRAEREAELMRRIGKKSVKESRDRLLIVGTQVLEQSLDVDFDFLITELCPMDLLIQRIGREHRHEKHNADRPERLRRARCIILEMGEEEMRKSVYSEYILRRTEERLRQVPDGVLLIPDSISELVQSVYDFECEEQKGYEQYMLEQKKAESRAETYRLREFSEDPEEEFNTLNDLIGNVEQITDEYARAAVRDGDSSFDVLVLRKCGEEICFLPWQHGGRRVPADGVPSAEEQREIASQKLRMPAYFNPRAMEESIGQLTAIREQYFPEWKYASLLRSELILLLEEDLSFQERSTGRLLQYSCENGLVSKKEEGHESGV